MVFVVSGSVSVIGVTSMLFFGSLFLFRILWGLGRCGCCCGVDCVSVVWIATLRFLRIVFVCALLYPDATMLPPIPAAVPTLKACSSGCNHVVAFELPDFCWPTDVGMIAIRLSIMAPGLIVGQLFFKDPQKLKKIRQRRQRLVVCSNCGRPMSDYDVSNLRCSACRAM